MRDEKEERKKQARSNKQTRQSNTAHPRQSLVHVDGTCHAIYYYEDLNMVETETVFDSFSGCGFLSMLD